MRMKSLFQCAVCGLFFLTGGSSSAGEREKPVWRKGALHAHTMWSDGRSLPEVAVKTYKDLKYDFMCISEHNTFPEGEYWMPVAKEEGSWPPNLTKASFAHAQELLPGKLIAKKMGVRFFVRLRTFRELQEMFEEKDKFILIPGEEITLSVWTLPGKERYSTHFNIFNMTGTILPIKGQTPEENLEKNLAQYREKAKAAPEKSFFTVNHPHAYFWDIDPVLLLKYPEITHFEIGNGPIAPDVQKLCSIEKYWDFILAHRIVRGQNLLYATASDDAHFYMDPPGTKPAGPDTGWVMVNAPELTPDKITDALKRGDFYASCGVELEDIIRDDATKTLTVKVKPEKDTKYTITFIVTKKNFDRTIATKKFVHEKINAYNREITAIPDGIGVTALTVSGTEGSYTLKDDDLYVRAVVASDKKPAFTETSEWYPQTTRAWTQPYCGR